MAQERVFPIFLDGAIQAIGSGTVDWNGETSRVECTGACTVTVGSGSVPGPLLCIASTASGTMTINIGHDASVGPFGDNAELDTATLDNAGESVTLMWTGKEWFYMGFVETNVVS